MKSNCWMIITVFALSLVKVCWAAEASNETIQPLAVRMTEAKTWRGFDYRFHAPARIEPGKSYPLVLLLHGAGERGTNNVAQLKWGADEIFSWFRARGEELYFVAGQVPEGKRWVEVDWSAVDHEMPSEPSEPMAKLMSLVEHLFVHAPVDRSRVYVTGLSMGGYGTWDIICRRPDWFAAAMPICGGCDLAQAWKLRGVQIWIYHGDRDSVVPFVRSRRITAALWACNGNVKYTEFPGVGHDSW